ncbi:MAG TPA: hypothetical protein VI854_05545, partial [Acidimicrobiia bacterium]|nr:hypothetical protein [Acidimicrobiia bacterium]
LAGSAGGADRTDLVERLAMFSAAAEQRCVRLADQLAQAEAFAATLQREIRRAKAPPRPGVTAPR